MKKLLSLLLLAGLAVAVADTNLTGKWSGSFNVTTPDGDTKDSTAVLMLKQSGTDISGTAGPDEGEQYPITKGKIEGNKITLEVQHENDLIKFNLTLADEKITGEAAMNHEGQNLKAKVDVTRAK